VALSAKTLLKCAVTVNGCRAPGVSGGLIGHQEVGYCMESKTYQFVPKLQSMKAGTVWIPASGHDL
jgi:hypothetical protein